MNQDSFIAGVQAQPDDDDLRRVYSDWLEDRGRPESDYLRLELELESNPEDEELRDRFWAAWVAVDPSWRSIFTQPQLLRANPSPYPLSHDFDPRPFNTLAPLPVEEFRGEFQWLPKGSPEWESSGFEDYWINHPNARARLPRLAEELSGQGFTIPEIVLRFLSTPELVHSLRCPAGSYFVVPRTVPQDSTGRGRLFTFYADSQGCGYWMCYLHPSGGYCILEEMPDDETRIAFEAPCFESFVCRRWLSNQSWYARRAEHFRSRHFSIPPVEGMLKAYMEYEDAYALTIEKSQESGPESGLEDLGDVPF